MSILYKDQKDFKYRVEVKEQDEKLKMIFSCDGGKFGTEEILDEVIISPLELLIQFQEVSEIKKKHAIDFASYMESRNSYLERITIENAYDEFIDNGG